MNILVTGGAGFIGSHTVVKLVEAGHRPVILDNFSNSTESVLEGLRSILGQAVSHVRGDCADTALLGRLFREEHIEGVIHFAASKAVGESLQKPLLYYRNNVSVLTGLLETMLAEGVKNLVFSSSCTVYGKPEALPVTEQTPVQAATSPYGNTKQIGEEIIRDTVAAPGPLRAISLRYFNPIGAHPSGHIGELPLGVPANLVPYLTQAAAGLRPSLTVYGNDYDTPDGTCIRDFIHVMDLAAAHVRAVELLAGRTETSFYEVFNVGTGRGVSVQELIDTFGAVNGVAVPYQVGPRREGDIVAIYADVQKVNRQMGWQAEKSLADGLKDAWNWQQQLLPKN